MSEITGLRTMMDSIGLNSSRGGQGTSPWLVNLTTAQPSYRYLFDGHVKTVEIHAKPPTQDTNLNVGEEYRVSYLVIVPPAEVQPRDRATITMGLLRDLRVTGTDADQDGFPDVMDVLYGRERNGAGINLSMDRPGTFRFFRLPFVTYELQTSETLAAWSGVETWPHGVGGLSEHQWDAPVISRVWRVVEDWR